MKIKNIACSQFAGLRDSEVRFSDGINVIYGKNESGKSTLVNLMSRILFQNAKLDNRKNKDFREKYFPVAKKGSGVNGDFADGRLILETERGVYTINKEWGSDPSCRLDAPDGIIKNQDDINKILREVLSYGEGVYTDMLFSPQKNMRLSLENILNHKKETDAKKEIIYTVSKAFAESDGISIDSIEQAIRTKIEKIAGKHWDIEREAPERRPQGGEWGKDKGEILEAYYTFKKEEEELKNVLKLEENVTLLEREYKEKAASVYKAEEERNKFSTNANALKLRSEREGKIAYLENDEKKKKEILDNWPVYSEQLEKARRLNEELANRETLDRYNTAKRLIDKIEENESKISRCPEKEEVKQVKDLQNDIAKLKNKLCGMNLNAAINMLGDNHIEVTSLRTGNPVDVTDGVVLINEAAKIIIPGVMEMQLSPADINVAEVRDKIAQKEAIISDAFGRYDVQTLDELDALKSAGGEYSSEIYLANNKLKDTLDNETFEELEAKALAIDTACRTKEEIYKEITEVCESSDITGFIAKRETIIRGYDEDYGSRSNLEAEAIKCKNELLQAKAAVSAVDNIPEEYSQITDPDMHLERLERELDEKRDNEKEALEKKTKAITELDILINNVEGDPAENVEKAELELNEKKSLLRHWLHIQEVFEQIKDDIDNNPMEDIAESFTNYLSFITGGKVSSEFPDSDKLNINIYSDDRMIDYNKLSEGTKETVSLAFRLAVLDHLFPEGGGVIVLDDPFTDMDLHRMSKSCELLKKCAEKHQVIFLTCREEYADMLCGNEIRI